MKIWNLLLFATLGGLLLNSSCSSDSTTTPPSELGGPVSGPADAHCAGRDPEVVEPAACTTPEDQGEGGAADEGSPTGEGGSDCNRTHDAEYGETLPGTEGDDDDCKYHVSWTSTPIALNQDVTFEITTTNLSTSEPLEPLEDGNLPLTRVEVYQPCDPTRRGPTQNYKAAFSEPSPGVYKVGPLRFDQSGRWVVRYHLYEECFDGEGSPHGHVAFFIDIP